MGCKISVSISRDLIGNHYHTRPLSKLVRPGYFIQVYDDPGKHPSVWLPMGERDQQPKRPSSVDIDDNINPTLTCPINIHRANKSAGVNTVSDIQQ